LQEMRPTSHPSSARSGGVGRHLPSYTPHRSGQGRLRRLRAHDRSHHLQARQVRRCRHLTSRQGLPGLGQQRLQGDARHHPHAGLDPGI
ncbi:hypothetical protein LTR53_020380, partial [Teratosphaeriaceae sp. CCFEE 6253]